MSQKQAKKLRQLYRRDEGKQVKQRSILIDEQIKEMTQNLDLKTEFKFPSIDIY
jgi:hypothetical protein